MLVANATGCSSIYGGNLPTTPWAVNGEGRGPAWSNSLFEDNAEFGLGYRLGARREGGCCRGLSCVRLAGLIGEDEVRGVLDADQSDEAGIHAQRERVATIVREATGRGGGPFRARSTAGQPTSRRLMDVIDSMVRTSLWIVGGDGWAYDIGFGGVDHVLGSGRNVNILVFDTEAYSNTGGQASKSTPRGAVAKFTSSGQGTAKKDLGAIARSYGDVYVAQVAIGANDIQTVKAFLEADAWPGPSLVIAYSTCIAHGIDMSTSMSHQRDATRSGYWPLYRYRPERGRGRDPDAPRLETAVDSGQGLRGERRPGSPSWSALNPSERSCSQDCCRPTSTNDGTTTNSSRGCTAASRT